MAPTPTLNLFPNLGEEDIKAIEKAIELTAELPLGSMDQWRNKEELEVSIAVDKSGLTSALILSAHVDNYLKSSTISLADIIQGNHQDVIAKPTKILSLLSSPGITSAQDKFKETLATAAKLIDITDVEEVLLDPYTLAFLRLNALTTFKCMRRDQFVSGSTELRTPFQLNTWVHEFVNINSMIAAATRQPMDGVTLTLIRDPEVPENSYFGFLVRYGENIMFLSDKPHFDNPGQSSWIRNPGRGLERRMNKSLFPYSVLDIKFDARDRAYVTNPKFLVLHQETAFRVEKLSSICKDEALWAVLLTDLIQTFICKAQWKKEDLSYTAEMVINPQVLQDRGIIVPAGYNKLEVPILSKKDVSHAALKDSFGEPSTGCRNWLEDLYGSGVNESVLQIDSGNTPLLTGATKEEESKAHLALKTQNLTAFGTKEEIQKSRIWLARWNYTRQILVNAKKDYKEKITEVKAWYLNKLLERLPMLMDAVSKEEFLAPHEQRCSGWDRKPLKVGIENVLKRLEKEDNSGNATNIIGGYSRQFDGYYGINNEIGTQRFCFDINNSKAIALICGCEVSELPIYLQHHHVDEPYTGNWALDDVDPMESFFHMNPWEDFPARVILYVSNPILQKYRKRPFSVYISQPDAEFKEHLEKVKKEFGRLKDKKTERIYRIKSYYKEYDSIQLSTKWRKNMQLNSSDVFYNFDIIP